MDAINYAAMQPQANIGQSFGEGFNIGNAIQQARIVNEQKQRALDQSKQLDEDVRNVFNNPDANAKDYAGLTLKYPTMAEHFKNAWGVLDKTQQNAKFNAYLPIYAAVTNGKPEVAIDLLNKRAEAYKNAGDTENADGAKFYADLIKQDPNQAKNIGGLLLASVHPEKFSEVSASLFGEQRKQGLAPSELVKSQFEADKAGSDAITAEITAKNAPNKQSADIANTIASTANLNNKPALDAAKLAAKDDPLGIQTAIDTGASGDTFLSALPKGISAQVKALAEGKLAFPSGKALTSDKVQQLLQAVAQYDPSFDASDYNKRNRTAQGFSAGKQGDAVKAVNQTISHMASLKKSIDDLANFDGAGTMLNPITNYVQEKAGDPRQGLFKMNVQAVSSELRKVFAGSGGGSLAELEEWKNAIPLNASHEQQTAYLKRGVELLHGGIDALEQQYQAGMGTSRTVKSLLSPKAKSALAMFDGEPAKEDAKKETPHGVTDEDLQAYLKSGGK